MIRPAARWIERCLWMAGFLATGYCAMVWLNARWRQAEGSRELDRRIQENSAHWVPVSRATKAALAGGDVVGRLEVRRLQMSAVVFEGTDDAQLDRGAGHLRGSALPGEPGNVVFAGHRDTFFRDLQNIQEGDIVTVTTGQSVRRYAVESMSVVNPDQTSVLDDTATPRLTLITCYPFRYLGSAPQRFIVQARELAAQSAAWPPETMKPSAFRQPRAAVLIPLENAPRFARPPEGEVSASTAQEPPPKKRRFAWLNPVHAVGKIARALR